MYKLAWLGLLLAACSSPDPNSVYSARESWERSSGGLNLSSFIFLDIDLDGTYSVGDRPISGIQVELEYNDQRVAVHRSNINGFVNFRASMLEANAPINRFGSYIFRLVTPTGWSITTDNGVQSRSFEPLAGSVSGGTLGTLPTPVGLSPELVLWTDGSDTAGQLFLHGPDQVVQSLGNSSNNIRIRPGSYSVSFDARTISNFQAEFYPIHLGNLSPRDVIPQEMTLLDFEDTDPSGAGLQKIPNGYAGYSWSGFNAISRSFVTNGVGYVNGTTSGSYSIYTSSGHPASISRSEPFDFAQAYVSVSWPEAEGETLTVEFWRDSELIRSDTITLSAYSPILYRPEMTNITEVRFITKYYWQLIMDDIMVSQ